MKKGVPVAILAACGLVLLVVFGCRPQTVSHLSGAVALAQVGQAAPATQTQPASQPAAGAQQATQGSGAAGAQAAAPAAAAETGSSSMEEKKAQLRKEAAHTAQEAAAETKQALKTGSVDEQLDAIEKLGEALPSLGAQDQQAIVSDLVSRALNTDNNERLRAKCAAILVHRLGTDPTVTAPIEKLASDQSPVVRQAIASGLSSAPKSTLRDNLVDKLAKDSDAGVQAAAVHSRALLLAAEAAPGAYSTLIASLGNQVGDASAQAALQLVIKGGERPKKVLPSLITAMKKSADARQRESIGLCIAMICAGTNPQQQKFAKLAKATKTQAIRLHPAETEGVPILLQGLKDPDPYVREICAQGLGYIGDPATAAALGKELSDPVAFVRIRAASSLVTVPAKTAEPELEKAAIKDPNAEVRRYAVDALGWIDDPSVIPTLIAATHDRNDRVRRYAAVELGERNSPEVVQALIALFKDPNVDVRWQAVMAVGKLQSKQATNALITALKDPSPQVSNAAERALQRLGIAKRTETHLRPAT